MAPSEADKCAGQTSRPTFETLLIEVWSRFIDLPAEEADGEIEVVQRRVCEYLDLDSSTLWQQPPGDPGTLVLTHVYQRPGSPPVPAQADGRTLFPWSVRQLQRGETIVLSDIDALPPEASDDRQAWHRFGANSSVVVPLSIGGVGFGGLSFACVRARGDWSETLIRQLRLVARAFSSALARARSEKELRESRDRYALAVEGANDGLWDWDISTDRAYFSPRWKSMLGYEDHEVANMFSTWQQLLHPADRDMAVAALQAHLAGQTPVYELEHRLRCKDGNYRWVLARGKALRHAEGKPYRMAGSHTDITSRKESEEKLRQAYEHLEELRDQCQRQNVYMRQEVKTLHGHARIVGQSRALRHVLLQAEQVAPTRSTVLLLGETGTGKELIASTIHELSPRGDRAMVRVNCSAIPASLIESELFGREKGAYTGALSKQIGRFETAHKSTLFLDEIGDLPTEVQVKLLRVLQERQIERLGSSKPIDVDVRIIAATNKDLDKAVREGRFRQDLYYRLNVFPIMVPPLRERREDIPPLVSAFVAEFGAAFGKNIESISKDSMEKLRRYPWPGNVRELRNVVERAMIVANGPTLWIDRPDPVMSDSTPSLNIWEHEAHLIRSVLEMTGWRIRGRNGAAEILGLKPTTLDGRMAKLGIRRGFAEATK